MRRRALLAGLASGSVLLAGCNVRGRSGDVAGPTGDATTRPLDGPLMQHGLTSEQGQYTSARLYRPGDSLPVTEDPDAAWLADGVDTLDGGQFALLTNLRTAGAAPAYVWPSDARWADGRLRIDLVRQGVDAASEADEVVGVALATFEVEGDPPASADVVFPGGAVLSVGDRG